MDLARGGDAKVGLVGLEGARERLGVREVLGEVTDCNTTKCQRLIHKQNVVGSEPRQLGRRCLNVVLCL